MCEVLSIVKCTHKNNFRVRSATGPPAQHGRGRTHTSQLKHSIYETYFTSPATTRFFLRRQKLTPACTHLTHTSLVRDTDWKRARANQPCRTTNSTLLFSASQPQHKTSTTPKQTSLPTPVRATHLAASFYSCSHTHSTTRTTPPLSLFKRNPGVHDCSNKEQTTSQTNTTHPD